MTSRPADLLREAQGCPLHDARDAGMHSSQEIAMEVSRVTQCDQVPAVAAML